MTTKVVGNVTGQANDISVATGSGIVDVDTQRVVLATDQPAVAVTAATLPLPTGAATAAKQPALGTAGTASADVITVQGKALMTPVLVDGSATTQPVSLASVPSHAVTNAGTFAVQLATAPALVAGTAIIGKVGIDQTTPGTTNAVVVSGTVTANAGTGTQAVSLASVPSHAVTNAGTFAVQPTPAPATTATLTNVASSATTVSLLASDATRKGVILYNDSTAVLYLKYGATASATSFTYYLAAGATWEMPLPVYTGAIDGIWAAANGNARITVST